MHSRLNQQNGFTLIEVLVALSLFGIVTAGIAPAFINFMKFNNDSQLKTEALEAAQQKLDRLRVVNPQTMPSSGSGSPETYTVNGRDFSVVTTYCSDATFCVSNNSRHLKVQVSYSGRSLASVETVYTLLR